MYERFEEQLLPRRAFFGRLARHSGVALAMVGLSLAIGVAGYRGFAHLSWVDAILNAAMILGGMGQVNPLPDDASKLFAAAYALFAGAVFLAAAGVFIAPVVHRFQHRLHLPARK